MVQRYVVVFLHKPPRKYKIQPAVHRVIGGSLPLRSRVSHSIQNRARSCASALGAAAAPVFPSFSSSGEVLLPSSGKSAAPLPQPMVSIAAGTTSWRASGDGFPPPPPRSMWDLEGTGMPPRLHRRPHCRRTTGNLPGILTTSYFSGSPPSGRRAAAALMKFSRCVAASASRSREISRCGLQIAAPSTRSPGPWRPRQLLTHSLAGTA